jgi:hypothetical protein
LVSPARATEAIYDLAENSPNGNALLIGQTMKPSATASFLSLHVTTQGGTQSSNTVVVSVLNATDRRGPETYHTPATELVIAGSVFQFELTGANFGPNGPESLLRFARQNADPIRSVRLFPPSATGAAQNSVVVQMDLAPAANGDFMEYAVRTTLGRISGLALIAFVEPRIELPFFSRATTGEIALGETVAETIQGARLTDVAEVVFDSPGITVTDLEPSAEGGASAPRVHREPRPAARSRSSTHARSSSATDGRGSRA